MARSSRWLFACAALVVSRDAIAQTRDAMRPDDRAAAGQPQQRAAGGTGDAYSNALRLARMLGDERLVASLLSSRALGPGASQADIAEVVESFEALGDPARARQFLEDRLRRFPNEIETRVQLAELLVRAGDTKSAVVVWKEVERRAGVFGMSTAQAVSYARALARVGDLDEAYRVLKSARPTVSDDAQDFWIDLATLAWERDPAEALLAYRKLWAKKYKAPGVAQRLMTLAHEAGANDEAIAVGIDDFKTNGDASSLLFAANLQSERGEWQAVKRTIALAEANPGPFSKLEEYWLLRGETYSRLGDRKTAIESFKTALALDPGSVVAQQALLWDAIERHDDALLAKYIDAWRGTAMGRPELWSAFAVGLDRLGRTREAIAFYMRQLHAAPGDYLFILEFADALERVQSTRLALRLRRFAIGKLQKDALAALRKPEPTADDRHLVEMTATTARQLSGAAVAERWLRAAMAMKGGGADAEAFAIEWYLADDRTDRARRHLLRAHRKRIETAKWREYRLAIALADEDVRTIADIVAKPDGLEANDRIEGYLALERDDLAGPAIGDALRQNAVDGNPEWRDKLVEIRDRHAPIARAGGTYVYISGLDVYGPDAVVARDVGRARVFFAAAGRRMGTRNASLAMAPVEEGDLGAMVRFTSPRGVTEVGAGFNYQPAERWQPATPLARGSIFDQRLVTSVFGTTIAVVANDKIEDTGLLRVAAVKYEVELGLRADWSRTWFAQIDVHGREDHTRQGHHIGSEVGVSGEAGYKLLTRGPEWDVGLQALAHRRSNVDKLPSDIAPLVPRGVDLSFYLPPSYELVSVVTHLTRGDFLQRYRPDHTAFPRYDCEAAFGILFPDRDFAVHGKCSVSFLVARDGYVSAIGFYNRGIAGIANQTNAEAMLSYTQTF